MELSWCDNNNRCLTTNAIRETVSSDDDGENHVTFLGPATGQVAYSWTSSSVADDENDNDDVAAPSVLVLVKRDDDELLVRAAEAVRELTSDAVGVHVLLCPDTCARFRHYFGVDGPRIELFERRPVLGFGADLREMERGAVDGGCSPDGGCPDLVCTLGGDGLLMYASSLFPGPMPPTLCVAGGSLGFLTPFSKDEMVEAICRSLGMVYDNHAGDKGDGDKESLSSTGNAFNENDVFRQLNGQPFAKERYFGTAPPTTSDDGSPLLVEGDAAISSSSTTSSSPSPPSYKYSSLSLPQSGVGVCVSMRMRLDCRVVDREGVVRARHNVLNEVVVDRGSSPFLSNLECFCDDAHLTTVQADGVIFSTPTGSTAYSMAAGGSVVHPAVPAILVTPICPHVLSFRGMVFPDSVVLRCHLPDDARSDACVAFDGKHRRGLRRGDSLVVRMSVHPAPTINRVDHSADWLHSLKSNFHFNTRPAQKPF